MPVQLPNGRTRLNICSYTKPANIIGAFLLKRAKSVLECVAKKKKTKLIQTILLHVIKFVFDWWCRQTPGFELNFARVHLRSFSSDAACELHILRHDGDSACMDGAQVGIFKETDKESLTCFLQSHNG